jgi:hypothetical protein
LSLQASKKRRNNFQQRFNSKEHGFDQGEGSGKRNGFQGNHPNTNNNNRQNMSQATSQSNQQDAEILSKNGNGVRQICDKHGNTYLNYFNRFNYSFQANDIPQALESLTIADNQIFEWFQDTVTLAHMIRNDGKLQNLQTLHW